MDDVSRRAPAPVAPVLRRLLYVAATLVFLAGVQLFVFPLRTARYFAWTIDPPMTAVFLGAAYWSALGLELGAARAASWSRARIAIPAVFVFTVTTLVVSLSHLGKLHFARSLALPTRGVAWAWLAVYATVPILMVLGVLAQRRVSTAVPPPSGLPVVVRVVLGTMSVVLLGLGVALIVAPSWADAAWPWALTPLTSGAVGAWLVGLGVATTHALLVNDRASLQPLALTGVLFGGLQAIALARHGGDLDWSGVPAVAYVAGLATLSLVSAWALLPPRRQPQRSVGWSHAASDTDAACRAAA